MSYKGAFNLARRIKENDEFRQILNTSKRSQLVLMCLYPREEIGLEIHNVDQFIKIESGDPYIIVGKKSWRGNPDTAILVPAGVKHNVINDTNKKIKLFTIYSPPEHEHK